MEDLLQEEGEFSLKCLNKFHSTPLARIQILVNILYICLKVHTPRKKTFGCMSFVCLALHILFLLCKVAQVFFYVFVLKQYCK